MRVVTSPSRTGRPVSSTSSTGTLVPGADPAGAGFGAKKRPPMAMAPAMPRAAMEAVMRFLYDLDGEQLALRVESFDLGSLDKRGRNLALDLTLSGLELPKEQ